MQRKRFDRPDETRQPPKGQMAILNLANGMTFMRGTLEPGWRWSEHLKPTAGTDSCQAAHAGYVLAGRLRVRLDDGSEEEFGQGDVMVVPPGHDAWVVGDEPFTVVDVTGGPTLSQALPR
jgi:quercetin dioxygenase-like cupin family protein